MPLPQSHLLALLFFCGALSSATFAQPLPANPFASDARIVIEARLDEKPARLLFDTGASATTLFTSQATRLGIKSESVQTANIAGHQVSMGMTPLINLSLLGRNAQAKLSILPFPPVAECDGVLSWLTLGDAPYFIDASARRIQFLRKLPPTGWQRWPLDTKSTQLFFDVTQEGKSLGRVFVDTGASIGLRISPQLWADWKKQNPKAGITLTSYRYAVGEPMVHELAWTAEYRLGDLLFQNVDIGPIPEAKDGKAIAGDGKEFIATIGIGALLHLRMIASRGTKEILTQPTSSIPEHNRLGAVFIPSPNNASLLIARISKDTPADKAGLKEGDVLLSINGVDFSKGAVNPEPFLMQPAGTKLALKVERGQVMHEFTVLLQNLLP